MSYKPKDCSNEDWLKLWGNSHYVLQPLADLLMSRIKIAEVVKPTDFDCPNHYAKMAYEAGLKAALSDVLGLLPDSVDKIPKK
jgi:hypothetical protein